MKTRKVFVYGLLLGIALLIWTFLNQKVKINSWLAILMTILFLGIYVLTILSYLKSEKSILISTTIRRLLLIGTIGISIVSSGYLIGSKSNDTSYSANIVKVNQIESTAKYNNVVKWSIEIFKFNAIIYLILLVSILILRLFIQAAYQK